MFKAFVYRLYPSKSQIGRLESVRETCRRFYNRCLAERKEAYEERGETISKTIQLRKVKFEKVDNPYAADINSHVLQNVVSDLDKAFQAFFRRAKSGESPGYPRFKSRNRFSGFGFKQYGNGFKVDGRRLRLSGIGRVSVRWHREIEGKIKTARVYSRAGKWFVAFCCDVDKPQPIPKSGGSVGVDVGLLRIATLSNGERIENPRWYRQNLRKLRIIQRSISRKKHGGSNRRKAVRILQRNAQLISNSRKDFINKLASRLVNGFDKIVIEDLQITEMVRGRFSASIMDAGWGYLKSRLTHKAESAGREVIKVDPAYTSKTCSGCGVVFENLKLSDRWVECSCGVSLDRDHNAAINILNRGLGRSPWASSSAMAGLAQEAARL